MVYYGSVSQDTRSTNCQLSRALPIILAPHRPLLAPLQQERPEGPGLGGTGRKLAPGLATATLGTQPSPGMLPAATPVPNPTLSPASSPDLLQGLGLPHAPFAGLQEERLHRANSSPRALPGPQVTASLLAHLVSLSPTATTRCQGPPDPRCRLPVQGSGGTRTSPHAALQADRCCCMPCSMPCSMPSPRCAPRDTGFLACSMQIGPKIALLFPSAHSDL